MAETLDVGVDQGEFRSAVGCFATGVTVITTHDDGADFGATVSAFSSVSDTPPTVLVCLNNSSDTAAAIERSGTFVVNILSARQASMAMRFAGKGVGKFDSLVIGRSPAGDPILPDCHAALVARVLSRSTHGTHTVLVAAVDSVVVTDETSPLVYHRSSLGRFAHPGRGLRGQLHGGSFGHLHDLW